MTPGMKRPNAWIPFRRENSAAACRLFCFPFAGGGSSLYRTWQDRLLPEVEVCAVQLPGRESRIREQAYDRIPPLIAAMTEALGPELDRPFVLFGHSLGALVAYEFARTLRDRRMPQPRVLIVSGRGAPHLPARHRPFHLLPDAEFRAELRQLEGTPSAILDNDEMMRLFLPTLRADFAAHETHHLAAPDPLSCPILCLGGAQDRYAPLPDLDAWRDYTTASFEVRILPGGHFYHQARPEPLFVILNQYLETVCQSASG